MVADIVVEEAQAAVENLARIQLSLLLLILIELDD
jgi:hypothetical protein